jgi:hypothetical protein
MLPAKLYASVLEGQVSPGGARPEGQFGLRRRQGTLHAAFILCTIQEQTERGGGELWACFVHFWQVYDMT